MVIVRPDAEVTWPSSGAPTSTATNGCSAWTIDHHANHWWPRVPPFTDFHAAGLHSFRCSLNPSLPWPRQARPR
jgi:hypothetical protein